MARQGSIVNVAPLVRALAEFGSESVDDLASQGMGRVMAAFEAKSVELCPVDRGNLEASTVVRVERRGDKVIGKLTYSAPYAAEVHELPDEARGPKTMAKRGNEYGPAGPRYVQRVLQGFTAAFGQNMADALRDVWRKRSR